MKYIALLRGINVGGNNKIAMPDLKAEFINNDFKNVITYINSGNVIFESGLNADEVKTICEKLITERFGLSITVGIITLKELTDAISNAPKWWNADTDAKHNALFVIPPMTAAEVCAEIGEAKPESGERISCHGNVIFWTAPLATFNHTRWSKIVANKKAYNAVTIRNANTTLKLAELTMV